MRNFLHVNNSFFAKVIFLPMTPFVLYYIWFFALYIGDHVAALIFEGRGMPLLISLPENYLWYISSKWLVCVALALLISNALLVPNQIENR